jgi:cell division septal protein FtsQ
MSSRLVERRRKRLLLLAGIVFGCVFAVFLFFWWFFNASFLKITSIQVSGENVIPESSITNAVQDDISGSYLGLFSRSSIFLYPKNKIVADLTGLYPTLSSVSINAQDFHTINVVVSEREAHALWCGSDPATAQSCFLLDTDGLAYANAPQYSGEVFRTYYGPLPSDALPQQFLSQASFHSLAALVDAFQGVIASDTVQSISIDTNDDVHLAFDSGAEILFALHDDSGQIFQRFSLALTAEPLLSHPLSDFEYVDLRFGDKVYYKLKNQ